MATFLTSPYAAIILLCFTHSLSLTEGLTKDEVIKRLFTDYNAAVRPNSETPGHPTRVEINFYARDFFITDHSMRYVGAQLTFRQKWNDPRLSYPESQLEHLSLTNVKKLWLPDLFFSNSKKGQFNEIMEPNVLLRIFPNGDVLYSRRVTVDFRCETKSSMFPLAKTYCPVIVAPYGSSVADVILEWEESNPVQTRKDLSLPGYRITFQDVSTCNARTKTGEYSCLRSNFMLELHHGSVFYLLYLPPFVLVLLGWLSFFLQGRSCKVRLPLLLVTLVLGSLCCGHSAWRSPDSLVTTAADVWSGLCLSFVLYALVHSVMTRNVHCVARACGEDGKHNDSRHGCNEANMQPMLEATEGLHKNKLRTKLQSTTERVRHLLARTGNKADIIARMFYPTAFIASNIVYWAVYNHGVY